MNASAVRVRPAELGDAHGIAAVHIQSWRETYAGVIPDRFMDAEALDARRRMWELILSTDPLPGSIAVAERGTHVVGFAFAGSADHPDATKGVAPARALHLYSLYLLLQEQGAGVGRGLLEAVVEDRPAQLWILRDNERAREFYAHHGFREDGPAFVDPDIDGLVEVRMVR